MKKIIKMIAKNGNPLYAAINNKTINVRKAKKNADTGPILNDFTTSIFNG